MEVSRALTFLSALLRRAMPEGMMMSGSGEAGEGGREGEDKTLPFPSNKYVLILGGMSLLWGEHV